MKTKRFAALSSFAVVSFLTVFGSIAAAQPSTSPRIIWSEPEVSFRIGNTADEVKDTVVTFVSSTQLSGVEIWVTPELKGFVSVSPGTINQVEPNTPYQVRLTYSVRPSAPPGSYTGTIHIRQNARTIPTSLKLQGIVDYTGINIPPTTKVVSQETIQYLTISSDGLVYTFSQNTSELQDLQTGDVLVGHPTEIAPFGFLRKVTKIQFVNGSVVIETTSAALEEALQDATIQVFREYVPSDAVSHQANDLEAHRALAPSGEFFSKPLDDVVLYDEDKDLETKDDQVLINGNLTFRPKFSFYLSVRDFELQSAGLVTGFEETAKLEVSANISFWDLDEKEEVAFASLPKIVVWVGWVPVVICPNLSLVYGIKGDLSGGVATSVDQQASLTAGAVYAGGNWELIHELDNSFGPLPGIPVPYVSLEAEIYGGPQLNLLLYGIVGPKVNVKGFCELNVDTASIPWWVLYAGVKANVGWKFEVLSHKISDKEFNVIGYRIILAQAPVAQGEVSGIVRDAVSCAALPGVLVHALREGAGVASTVTDGQGRYSLSLAAGGEYDFVFSLAGYVEESYHSVTPTANQTQILDPVMQVNVTHSGPGDLGGRVINALTGQGVPGATVELRRGLNAVSGGTIATAVTTSSGGYLFTDIPGGNYTALASAIGYSSAFYSVLCLGGMSIGNQELVITPILAEGETRIILTWGQTPSDLDSHLTGPLPDGSRFHMYFPLADSNWGSPWPDYVHLDLDDTSSYGPETSTILQQSSGIYRFYVHDYSNGGSYSSTALSNSGAQVRVYRGSTLAAAFNVPPNSGGTLWTVFEMVDNQITPINSISYSGTPYAIQALRGMSAPEAPTSYSDSELLLNLPPK